MKSSLSSTLTKSFKKIEAEIDYYNNLVERPVFELGSLELEKADEW